MVPTKAPGTIFSSLMGDDSTLNIRWLKPTDPAFYEVLNRPLSDLTVRQLVIAKALDALQIRLGHQNLFPFLVQPKVSSGTSEAEIPAGLIWDLHASLPQKWEKLRLAKVKRLSGTNGETSGYTGWLRFIFTAHVEGSTTEVAIFQADYQIDSDLTYQSVRLDVVETPEETVAINAGERETAAGFLIFRTMDLDLTATTDFLDLVAPPTDTTDSDTDGFFDNPAIYEVNDSATGGASVTGDFALLPLSHGTGLLTDSAWNAIPQLDADAQTWLTTLNYPFDLDATRTSTIGVVIPSGLFREFNITAPAGDQPTGDTSGTFFPVWISRIEKVGSDHLRFFFSTYNVTDSATGGNPSTTGVEFASMDLLASYSQADVVEITPIDDLQLQTGTAEEFQQHFGRGHAVLSSLWDGTSTTVQDFFDAFDAIADSPTDTDFSVAATRLSAFGVSRVPKYTPTIGQSRAMVGTTAGRSTPINPSDDNRFVTEQDRGLGDQVDLEAQTGVTSHVAIDRYGYKGGLVHQVIKLVVDSDKVGADEGFYEDQILPRLQALFGRDPQFGDYWYNGTRLLFFNGDIWSG